MSDTDCTSEMSQISLSELKPKSKINVQVELRIKKKVPKSVVQNRLNDVIGFLAQTENFQNWKSLKLGDSSESSEIEKDPCDPSTPIETLFEKVLLGSCQVEDGAQIDLEHLPASTSHFHIYKLNYDGPLSQNIGDSDDDNIVGSQLWQLPCVEFENTWENLLYDSSLKNEIMSYVYALLHLSEKNVNSKIINVNRLILLVGPPGTGKTSLCKGLAQHLSIRLNNRYQTSVLVEINSHSLFSKWFSESGKLVQRMFDQIDELAEDPKSMVFVLIDEVESLGMCRESSKSEPADAIRAVNALLTQIDRVRRRPNILILCTSNLENSLDRALVDRADIVKHVGQPSIMALYSMLKSCILELVRIGIVTITDSHNPLNSSSSEKLQRIATLASGLSGRAISMLPTLVVSKSLEDSIPMEECLNLLEEAVVERQSRRTTTA